MSEHDKAKVLIEREGRVIRWGQDTYFKTWNGLKETVSLAAVKAIALPLAILLALATFFLSGRDRLSSKNSREIPPGTITRDLPIHAPAILTSNSNGSTLNRRTSPDEGRIKVVSLAASSQIPAGAEAKAVLDSGASNGIVKAKLTTALAIAGDIFLPEKTILIGKGTSSEERLFIQFNRAILPAGETIKLVAKAFDASDKILGLKGALISAKNKKLGMAAGFGALGAMVDGLQSDSSGSSPWGAPVRKSPRDAALGGASKAALDQSQFIMEEAKSLPNVIEVKHGTEFYLIVDESKSEER